MAADYAAIFGRVMEEAFSKGDLKAVDTYFTPNFIEHEPGPGQGNGREGVKTRICAGPSATPAGPVTSSGLGWSSRERTPER